MKVVTIFLSATTEDLGECRKRIYSALTKDDGFKVLEQTVFDGFCDTIRQEIQDKIDRSDVVIHLAGAVYGAEPEWPDHPPFPAYPDFRCSFTQYEFYYACLENKKVFSFLSSPDFYYPGNKINGADAGANPKPNIPDTATLQRLQKLHRERVKSGKFDGTPLSGLSVERRVELGSNYFFSSANNLLEIFTA